MSGWDVSSTPSWESQDGPDETQTFPAEPSRELGSQDFAARDFGRTPPSSPAAGFPELPGGYAAAGGPDGPPPEFFATGVGPEDSRELSPGGYPQRTPGQSLRDLPRREGRHSSAQPAGYGQNGGFGQDSAFGQNGGFGPGGAFGQLSSAAPDGASGRNSTVGQQNGFGPDSGFGQDNAYGQDSVYGLGWGGSTDQPRSQPQPQFGGRGDLAQQADGGWERGSGRPPAQWLDNPRQDAGYPDQPAAGFAGQDYGRRPPGADGQEYGRLAADSLEYGRPAAAEQEYGRRPGQRGQDGPGPDYPAQAYAGQGYAGPGLADPDYPGQDYPGRPGRGPQQPFDDRRDHDPSASLDPALQDFFAPQAGGTPGYQDPWADSPAEPAGTRYRQGDDWDAPSRSPAPARGPRPDQRRSGLGTRGFVAIGAVVAIIIVVAVVVFTRHSGSGATASGSSTPSASAPAASQPAGKASGTTSSSGSASTAAYVLSTPASADGFPKGSDPKFLAIATSTAGQVSSAVTQGAAGTVKGSPVSAAYELPVGGQVVTFVGYQGKFTPAKVATLLSSLGTDPHSYTPGPLGGILGCANTPATGTVTSGAVCVWADSSTLGVTEFFSSTGPEALTASQDKGAADTVAMRADIETKSS